MCSHKSRLLAWFEVLQISTSIQISIPVMTNFTYITNNLNTGTFVSDNWMVKSHDWCDHSITNGYLNGHLNTWHFSLVFRCNFIFQIVSPPALLGSPALACLALVPASPPSFVLFSNLWLVSFSSIIQKRWHLARDSNHRPPDLI